MQRAMGESETFSQIQTHLSILVFRHPINIEHPEISASRELPPSTGSHFFVKEAPPQSRSEHFGPHACATCGVAEAAIPECTDSGHIRPYPLDPMHCPRISFFVVLTKDVHRPMVPSPHSGAPAPTPWQFFDLPNDTSDQPLVQSTTVLLSLLMSNWNPLSCLGEARTDGSKSLGFLLCATLVSFKKRFVGSSSSTWQ